jgi:hypothetical protein
VVGVLVVAIKEASSSSTSLLLLLLLLSSALIRICQTTFASSFFLLFGRKPVAFSGESNVRRKIGWEKCPLWFGGSFFRGGAIRVNKSIVAEKNSPGGETEKKNKQEGEESG